MRILSVSDIQNKPSLFKDEVLAKIVDKRAKRELGFFISYKYQKEVEEFIKKIERKEKLEKLKRVAEAQKKDLIGDGAVGDGL